MLTPVNSSFLSFNKKAIQMGFFAQLKPLLKKKKKNPNPKEQQILKV